MKKHSEQTRIWAKTPWFSSQVLHHTELQYQMDTTEHQSGTHVHVYDLGSALHLLNICFMFTQGLLIEPSF